MYGKTGASSAGGAGGGADTGPLQPGQQVIIKLIKADRVHIPMAVSEFESEATVLSNIAHPNIVRLLGSGHSPRRFLVLELLDGGSLSHLLGLRPDAHNRTSRKKFSYLETLYLSRDLASALDYLHHSWHPIAHIVHRDLKPDNIGWTRDGTLKLFDFGLSTVIQAQSLSHAGYKLTGNTGGSFDAAFIFVYIYF